LEVHLAGVIFHIRFFQGGDRNVVLGIHNALAGYAIPVAPWDLVKRRCEAVQVIPGGKKAIHRDWKVFSPSG
jgi:hypothetical protein